MLSRITSTLWSFNGYHTTGQVHQVRDGIVTRYSAGNSNRAISPMHSNFDRAVIWLKSNDRRAS